MKISGVVMRNVNIDIIGCNNELTVQPFTQLENLKLKVSGDGNKVFIDSGVVIVSGEINVMGTKSDLHIGHKTTVRNASFSAIGDGAHITLGDDCMLGSNIKIWNGDVHPIYDIESRREFNLPKDITLGDHVWLGSDVVVLKGVNIGSGSVVGVGSLMTKSAPKNSLSVGSPAKLTKTDINWKRRR